MRMILGGAAIFVALICMAVPASLAEESGMLSLITSPLPINLITEPGKTVTADLSIKNAGVSTEKLKVSLMKFGAYQESGKPMLEDRQQGDDYFDWVSFSENEFEVAPNEKKTIKATFVVPSDAAFDYYYAVVFSRADDGQNPEGKAEKIVGATATLILLTADVPGAKREAQVVEFSTPHKIYEFLPASFQIKVRNTGNVHIAPRGHIYIDKGDQSDLAILDVNQQAGGNILPDTNRIFNAAWEDGYPVYANRIEDGKVVLNKNGKQVMDLDWKDFGKYSNLRWGKYTANLFLVYDDGTKDQSIEGQLSFWVIPWRLIIIILLIVILVLIGLWSIFRGLFTRKENKIKG